MLKMPTLREALETLENAIRKIDRETRTLFRDTFDRVNKGLAGAFPESIWRAAMPIWS
jgi:chromosome segregation protein